MRTVQTADPGVRGKVTNILFREVNARLADIELELTDCVSHRYRHGTCSDQMADLRGEVGHEVT